MTLDAWLCISFTLPTVLAYALWCVGWLPRARRTLAVVGVIAFFVAVVINGFFEPPARDDLPRTVAMAH